jgi:hypothetical protein
MCSQEHFDEASHGIDRLVCHPVDLFQGTDWQISAVSEFPGAVGEVR